MATQVTTTRYGRAALEALRDVVAGAKQDDPMAPVTILLPNNVAGIVARRFLAQGVNGHHGVAGLFLSTLPRLAEQLAAPQLTSAGRRPATRPVVAATIRGRLNNQPGIFAPVADHPSTSRAVARSVAELREVSPATHHKLEGASSLVKDLIRLHRETTAGLQTDWYDATDLLTSAAAIVRKRSAATAGLGVVVLYLPQDLSPSELDLARALAGATNLRVIAGFVGSPHADRIIRETLGALAPGQEIPAAPLELTATRVLHASDSDDEVRCVVREVVAALQSHPGHRVAVLYAARSPYARLLHEHLRAAGITTNGPGVRPVIERGLSRLLLGLLRLPQNDLRRADVFETLGEVTTRDFTGQRINIAQWERTSREAGVVAGSHWDQRLATHIATQQATIEAEQAQDDPRESVIGRATRSRDSALALRSFMVELSDRLDPASASATWSQLAGWAGALLDALVPPADQAKLPLEEQYAAGVIGRTLAGLAALDSTATPAGVEGLIDVLEVELESALPRIGRFGEGVLVAPITHAIGLDVDVLYLIGLSEDLCPGRIRDDSLLPERVRVLAPGELTSTRSRIDRKERCLLAAFASADEVVASFPRGDLRRHTERLPSRWLLRTLRELSGIPVLSATRWAEASGARIVSSPSFAGSLLTTTGPSSVQEWRTRAAAAHLALDEPVLDLAHEMNEQRQSARFTRFDGNLSGHDLPDYVDGQRPVSPTALERYAICPHAYFVERLLHIAPVESPEERLEISAMDVGNLIHRSFDALIVACAAELPGYGEPWTDAQRQQLQQIGAAQADEFEAAGLTGHRLLWTRRREEILRVLDWMIDDDNRWRAERDARVLASELTFGMHGQAFVEIAVNGGTVRFRGSADKVDQARDGRLFVTDIKTGSAWAFAKLSEDNPVSRGEKLQLPVYAHAARNRFGDADTPIEAMYWFVRKDRGKRVEVPLTPAVQTTYADTLTLLTRSIAGGVFPQRAPAEPDFRWVQCPYCNPDGLGHAEVRRRWETKRTGDALAAYTELVEPDAFERLGSDTETSSR